MVVVRCGVVGVESVGVALSSLGVVLEPKMVVARETRVINAHTTSY